VTEFVELTLVDTVDTDEVVTVAEVSVLVKIPGQMYWSRLFGSAVAPAAEE